MNTVSKKKTLLSCLLAACMGACALAGGLLIKADAESIGISSLVTVTNGVTVTAAKSYTTSAGDYTTPAGLYITAPADKSLSYGVEFNGIFTGSTGIKAYFPGEGFWDPVVETTITVTSVANAEETFQVHIGGQWQRYGYVTYDWNGDTLYRTINSYEGNSTYYYQEDKVKDVGSAQYLPAQGHMSDTDLGRREPYIGFEMQTDGTFNVVLISGHNAGVHKTIASFCEDKATFTPTTEASGTEPNLPKLDLSAGYTISIENSDNDNTKSFDLLIQSIATSETGDPYAEGNGTVYTLNTETLQTMPSFYQKWYEGSSVTQTAGLVTATGGATVTAAKSYTTSADDYTTPAGLYIAAPSDKSLSYGAELNGIFTGSTGIKAYFPGEGFWGVSKEMVITVASVSDSDSRFEIRIGGEWQQYGVVAYQYEEQTLFRSRGTQEGVTDTFFYTESGSKNVDQAQFIPAPGHFADTNLGRKTAYFGIEMQADGSVDVVLLSSHGYTYTQRITIASFNEDPSTFTPSESESGTTSNLPKLDFSNGYTIGFAFNDNDASKSYDFLIQSIATSETGDPYASGTVYTLNGAAVEEVPKFHTKWLNIPSITVKDHDEYVAAGQVITPPAATYATNGNPTATNPVEDVQYRVNGGDWSAVPADGIPACGLGDDVEVRYTVENVSETITLRVRGKASELVTVTGDAKVESAPKQYTLKNTAQDGTPAGTAVGDTGLYVTSTKDDSAGYSVALNGVFTGSVGMYVAFPGEGFWNDSYREAVMTVTSITDPEETFQLHIDGSWGTSGYVTYEHEGQTLIRSRAKEYKAPFNQETGEDAADWLYTKSPDYMYPIMSNFDAASTDASPMRNACYIGLEYTEDDVLNVIMTANTNWGAPYKRILASFAEEPGTFVPSTETKGATPNLPKLESLKDGYTIRFDISDQATDNRVDFLLKSIAVSETGDAYRSENGGTVYMLNGAWVEEVPEFYTAWLEFPSITVPQYNEIIAAGENYNAPKATYVINRAPEEAKDVTTIEYRVDGGDWTRAADGVIPADVLTAGAKVEVRYTVDKVSEIITLSVRNMAAEGETLDTDNIVKTSEGVTVTPQTTTSSTTGEGATNTSQEGLLFRSASAYSFDLVGRFEGDTTITWSTAADNDWDVQNRQVEFIIADATNPENYFKVVWRSPNQSAAWVEYVYNGTTLYCARDQWGNNTFYYTYADVTDNRKCQSLPAIGRASSSGILGLRWSGEVLNVVVLNLYGNEQVLASFENDLDGFKPVTTGTGDKSNLPKIEFKDGYTISVNVMTQSGAAPAAARSATAARSMKAARTAASEPRFLDFLLQKVETNEDTISFDDPITVEPVWSMEGQKMPTIDPLAKLPGMQLGENTTITVPTLNYTPGTETVSLSITWFKPDGTDKSVNAGDKLELEEGDHTLLYTMTAGELKFERKIEIHVCDYTTYVSGTPATCVATGIGTYECKHGKTMDKTLPVNPAAHDYRAKWTWDGATPSVEFECRDCDKKAQSTGEITVTEIEGFDSTCLTQGKKKLQASVIFGGYRYIDTEEVTLPLADHSYGEPEWKWNGYDSATAAFKCSVCGNAETVTAEIKAEEDTENNVRTYTATVTIGDKTYTDVKTESISAPHTHTLKAVAEKAATCTEAGNKAYWECSECGKLFLDAEGKTETTLDAVTVSATGHSYGEPEWKWNGYDSATAAFKCSVCGSTESVTAEIKTEEDVENGVRTYTATVTFGDKAYTDVKTESISEPHTHTLKAVAEKAATCTEAGNKAYWECEECGKLFLDAEGKTETTLEDVTLPATGQHNMVQVPAKAPTCTEDGNSAYYKCSDCGRCSSDDKGEMEIDESSMVLKAKGHTFENGKCTVCGAEDPDYVVPEEGLTGGQIAAIVVAAVVVAAGVVVAVVLVVRKKKLGGQK